LGPSEAEYSCGGRKNGAKDSNLMNHSRTGDIKGLKSKNMGDKRVDH